MKSVKSFFIIASFFLTILLSISIGVNNLSPTKVYGMESNKIKLNNSSLVLIKGENFQLKISGTNKKVTWSSNNKKVATISSKGIITTKNKGKATIMAKVSNKKYTCKLTVEDPVLSSSALTILEGTSQTLKLKNTSQKITWSSKDKNIATVSSNGIITGISEGSTIINAQIRNKTYSCNVTIERCTAPSTYTLKDGYYTVGIDIPSGIFDVEGIAGCGFIISDNDGANIKGPEYSEKYHDEYSLTYKNYKITQGEILEIKGVEVKLTYTTISSNITGRTYDESKGITLSPGNYTVGKDIDPGRYCVKYISGGGGYVDSDRVSGLCIIGNNMDGDPNTGEYTDYVSNILLETNETFTITSGLTVMFIPEVN